MYRKEIKVLDCTIRDGGLINKWQFSDKMVKNIFNKLSASGIDYMEIGYKASKKIISPDGLGKWRFCEEKDIKPIVEETNMKLSAMVDIGRVDTENLLSADKSVFSMIRVATYVKDVDKAIDLVKKCHDKGYETTVNIMAVSTALEMDIDEALQQLNKSEVPIVYVVDSYGSMYSEQIAFLVKKYKQFLPKKTIGIHAHNNQQLAFANTIEAVIQGTNILDATIYGIGRGAGNCPLELLLGFLKNPKFELRPILDIIQTEFVKLRENIEWGYIVPYAITGILNEHPRAAIAWRESSEKDEYKKFFDSFNTTLIE